MKFALVVLSLFLVGMLPMNFEPRYIYDASKTDFYETASGKVIMSCEDWVIATKKLDRIFREWQIRARMCGSITDSKCAVDYLMKNWTWDRLKIAERKLWRMKVGKPGGRYGVPEQCPIA